ncbi:HpcH/HpaI aldolase family protein [Sphingomonas solaris]|uniref:2,4-dihydroxyhept-2-ene-1,7-dioic acid aldolase n=1 Tax=Alterirhizorhabdus solaris TaxID=2529389 RepID=A0A558RBD8_9SPHN|nr:aldolase/citrate lyase family protein [Sphingomonas solaris]TVV76725.1 2,4-dihydroxyhept-2-ene-1,7-dioic acid aldolase [Sphingomonas solaris]
MDKVRKAIADNGAAFGAWAGIADGVSIELMGKAGFDFVILDTQHGGIGWADLLTAFQALDVGGTRGLVRVGWTDPMQIMRAMDLGALGVVVPMVSTAEQARPAAQAVRYPPHGIRSFGPVRSAYTAEGTATEPLCMVMIETAEAIDNVDAIAATPGVDGLFVGPVDLALSLGLGAALVMPDAVKAAIDKVVAACRRHDVVSGCAALGAANAREMMDRGVQFITIGADAGYIRRGAAADVAEARRWIEERGAAG